MLQVEFWILTVRLQADVFVELKSFTWMM